MEKQEFQKNIWDFYKKNKRELPWRQTHNPYKILVSEIMLQQTQVKRVLEKYPQFLKKFPNFSTLADSNLHEVLSLWQGMGYNRRAKYLYEIAKIIKLKYNGKVPQDIGKLDDLPGIGTNTAGSIAAFAFNIPAIFIETNIRRVFIHHFFKDYQNIDDKDILHLISETIDMKNPRDWYYALMDYGNYLAKTIENPNKKSKHYSIQSHFEGSSRQIRSKIMKALIQNKKSKKELIELINDKRFEAILEDLIKENFVVEKKGIYSIK